MLVNKNKISPEELLSFSKISLFLTGRKDIIRKDRIPKQYKEQIGQLINYLKYWCNENK